MTKHVNHPHPIAVTVKPLAQIKPDPTNPKKHPKRQVQKLAAAYAEFGFISRLLVDEAGVIIAGHGRWLAAERLGLTDVLVIVFPGLSNEQKKALRIADNKIGEDGRWDADLLANDFRDLIAANFEIELTGYDSIEIDRLLAPPPVAGSEEEIPLPPEDPTSRSGDLWQCGDHRVFCGDSREPASFERLLQGHLADMVFTDVPYNLRVPGMVSGKGAKTHGNFAMASGEMSEDEFMAFCSWCCGWHGIILATGHCTITALIGAISPT